MTQKGVAFFADALILLVCLIGFYHVWQKAGLPITFSPNSLVIEKVYSHRSAENIFKNEKVLSVNGYKIDSQEELEFILDGLSFNKRVTLQLQKFDLVRT